MVDSPGVEEIRAVWGDRLHPVPAELLPPDVPASARRVLTTAGLPDVEMMWNRFRPPDRLSELETDHGREYLVVADIAPASETPPGNMIGVDIRTGRVIDVHRGSPEFTRLASSDLACFLYFSGRLWRDLEVPGEQARTLADFERLLTTWDQLHDALTARDPDAMTKDNLWQAELAEWGDQLTIALTEEDPHYFDD